jgi:hypothetical protein
MNVNPKRVLRTGIPDKRAIKSSIDEISQSDISN